MTGTSPLLDRVNSKTTAGYSRWPRLRIPRKGRIRIALALFIIAVAGYKLCGALLESSGGSAAVKRKPSHAAAAQQTHKGGLAPFDAAAAFPVFGNKLDFHDIAQLLARNPPHLTHDRDTVSSGGVSLVACYSIDTALQAFVAGILKQYRPKYGSGAVIDPKTGRVLALISYQNDTVRDIGGNLFLRNVFPAASIYKTVTAAAAIEKAQYTPQTLVPVTGQSHTLYHCQLKKEIAPWKEISFEEAYAFSINPVFGRLGMHTIGKKTLEEYAERFGFNTKIPFELEADTSRVCVPDDTSYAMAELASGFNRRTTISALHGALIAAAVAENGVMPCPTLVDSVCGQGGERLYRSQPAVWKTPISAATAGELRLMMNQVVEKGTGHKAFRTFRRCAWSATLDYGGKTGSIELDSVGKIDWFIGYAFDRDDPSRCLSLAFVTAHGEFQTVHSSFIGAEIFRRYLHPAKKELLVKKSGSELRSISDAASSKPKG
jgi:penicillin-binding protein A